MNLFLINVLLAVGFMIALESFTLQTLVAGLVVGYGALWLTRPLYGDKRYFQRIPTLIGLIVFLSRPFSSRICGCSGMW